MIKEHRKKNIKRIKLRRFEERKKIPFPISNEGWVEVLERRKENVLNSVIGQSVSDRRINDRRSMDRRLPNKNIQAKTVLVKEEIDYIFKLLSTSNKIKSTVDL